MRSYRLLITGASGAGTTALGRALADRWSVPHADVDDYFWVPTSAPYTKKRPVDERLSLMGALFLPAITGSFGIADGVGGPSIERFSAVVFLTLDPSIRMDRLKERETARYGSEFNAAVTASSSIGREATTTRSSRVVAGPGVNAGWLCCRVLSFGWTVRNRCRDYWTP